jgi:hypothetical protein
VRPRRRRETRACVVIEFVCSVSRAPSISTLSLSLAMEAVKKRMQEIREESELAKARADKAEAELKEVRACVERERDDRVIATALTHSSACSCASVPIASRRKSHR